MKLSCVLNKAVTIDKDISLIEIAKIFSKKKMTCVVFIKDGVAAGIITERDIIKNIEDVKKKKISQVMSKKLVTIGFDKSLEDAVDLMCRKKIKKLLVVDSSDDLVGIITATDIIANADLLNRSFSFLN